MITSTNEEELRKGKIKSSNIEGLDPELLQEQINADRFSGEQISVEGELNITQTPEGDILKQIEAYKADIEREHKENLPSSTNDDPSATVSDDNNGDDNDDDDDVSSSVPIKYYGYQIPKKVLNELGNLSKLDIESADDWLKVWLARVMEKVN